MLVLKKIDVEMDDGDMDIYVPTENLEICHTILMLKEFYCYFFDYFDQQ